MNATWVAPGRIGADYVEMGTAAAAAAVGLPLNALTLSRLIRHYRRQPNSLSLLHINLNVSDLMVLCFYSCGRLSWLLTYQWYGGELLCRLMRFLEELSFSISSNIIVAIALDRLLSLSRPQGVGADVGVQSWVMLGVAWGAAVVFAAPQMAVYEVVSPVPNFSQCVSFWVVGNRSETHRTSMLSYNAAHLLILFWLPALGLISIYTIIVHHVLRSIPGSSSAAAVPGRREEMLTLEGMGEGDAVHSLLGRPSAVSVRRRRQRRSFARKVSGHSLSQRNKMRAIRTSLLLTTFYIVCWLPYMSLGLWILVNFKSYRAQESQVQFAFCLIMLNSVCNPIIYGRLRLFKLKRCRKLCCQTNS